MNMKNRFSEESFKKLLKKYAEGAASEEECKLVDNWLNDLGKDKEAFLSDTEAQRLEERVWESIARVTLERTTLKRGAYRKKHEHFWIPLSIAASTIFIIFFAYFSPFGFREESTGIKEVELSELIRNDGNTVKTFILSDQTQVRLYPHSRLEVNRLNVEAIRKVKLSGKAYFHVSRDESKPFIVYAGDITTTVLGTSFTINAFEADPDILVSVETGKVAVSNEPASIKKRTIHKELILVANQQAVFNPVNGELEASIVADPIPVTNNAVDAVEYNEEPVINILRNLQNLYGVKIRFDDRKLSNCKITTRFDDEGLFDRLNVLSRVIGGTYKVEETTIIFKNPGCK